MGTVVDDGFTPWPLAGVPEVSTRATRPTATTTAGTAHRLVVRARGVGVGDVVDMSGTRVPVTPGAPSSRRGVQRSRSSVPGGAGAQSLAEREPHPPAEREPSPSGREQSVKAGRAGARRRGPVPWRAIPSTPMKAQRSFTVRPHLPLPAGAAWTAWPATCGGRGTGRPGSCSPRSTRRRGTTGGHDPRRVLAEVSTERLERAGRAMPPSWSVSPPPLPPSTPTRRLPRWFQREVAAGRIPTVGGRRDGASTVAWWPTSPPSSASPRPSRSTRAASACSPATTSRRPATSASRSSASASSTATATSASTSTVDGWQQERFPDLDPYAMALEPCDGRPRHASSSPARPLVAQLWRADVGRIPLYLLDTDIDDNTPRASPGHRPALRRRRRAPHPPGDPARHRWRAGPRGPRARRRRSSTRTRATPASSASSASAG